MSWILTQTGKRFDLFNLEPDMIDPEDISYALAYQREFDGQSREFYSKAQHSCIVAKLVPEEHKLAALLHDAPNAYVADINRPLKECLFLYQYFEKLIWRRICERFDLPSEVHECVYHAHLNVLATECRDLMSTDAPLRECLVDIEPMIESIRPWAAEEARLTYHQRLMDQLAIEHRRKAA